MAQFTDRVDVREFNRSAARAPASWRLEQVFVGEASALPLVLIAGVPVLIGAWLLLSPARVLSREMTWDLLFNLDGAWRIHSGQALHVDFHDPLGSLAFLLTELGFRVVGPSPRAFLVGEMIAVAFAFVAAVIAAVPRLPPLPAVLFVLYASLLVLVPANIGEPINAYSFAMSYNRWGWSLLTTLCLLLFLPPRPQRRLAWLDMMTAGVLLVALFYLKITFAVAGAAALAMAIVTSDHSRAARRMWSLVLILVLANALAPYNAAYLADIGSAAGSGYARTLLSGQILLFFANEAEYALYGSGILLLLWLWWRGQAPMRTVVVAAFVLCLGMFVLSQNAQQGNIPIGVVIAYLVYGALRHARPALGRTELVVPLVAILLWPALSVASAMTTLAGYHVLARRDAKLLTVDATNLRGLAVPTEDGGLDTARLTIGIPHRLLSSTRETPQRDQVSQHQYVQTLIEASALFAGGRRGEAKIFVLDQVNPMPFALGYPPPRGGSLWLWHDGPTYPAEDVFADVDIVLIPKYSTYARSTVDALTRYHDYLAEHFPVHEESPSWTILTRRSPIADSW
jgi:hypothetical protein